MSGIMQRYLKNLSKNIFEIVLRCVIIKSKFIALWFMKKKVESCYDIVGDITFLV